MPSPRCLRCGLPVNDGEAFCDTCEEAMRESDPANWPEDDAPTLTCPPGTMELEG